MKETDIPSLEPPLTLPLVFVAQPLARCLVCLVSGLLGAATLTLFLITASTSTEAMAARGDDGVWTTYTTAHGLPSNTVYGGVAIDDGGQVWAGFEYGEYHYPLPTNPLVSQLLSDNSWVNYELPGCRVRPLVASTSVFVGTSCAGPHSEAGGGLSWFINDAWVTFTSEDGMRGDYVNAVAPEGETKVWTATGYNNICFYNINLLDHNGTPAKEDDEWSVYELDFCSVRSIAIDPAGNRWFGFTTQGVSMLTADGSSWITYTTEVISGAADIAFDAMGNAWFGYGQKVARFDGEAWTYYNSREAAIEANYEAVLASLSRNRVNPYSLPGLWAVEIPAGVWIIRQNVDGSQAGAAHYNGSAWSVYTDENSELASNDVRGIAVDEQKNIWLGTRPFTNAGGGLSRFTPWPDFELGASPAFFLLAPGSSATIDISIALLRGWVPTVTLSLAGLPSGSSAAFYPHSVSPSANAQLRITTAMTTPLGLNLLNIVGTGVGLTRTKMITLSLVAEVERSFLALILNVAEP